MAQLVNTPSNASSVPTVLERNDLYDQNKGVTLGNQIYANSGTYVASPVVFDNTNTPPLPAFNSGQTYVPTEFHTSGNYGAVVSIIKPDGTTLLAQDTDVDETVVFTAPVSGNYKRSFDHFSTTTGSFSFTVNEATVTQYVTSGWNLLAFRTDTGAYVATSSLTTDNIASNEPVEPGSLTAPAARLIRSSMSWRAPTRRWDGLPIISVTCFPPTASPAMVRRNISPIIQ